MKWIYHERDVRVIYSLTTDRQPVISLVTTDRQPVISLVSKTLFDSNTQEKHKK